MQLYANIKIGSTEYRVSPGGSIKVDRLDAEPGAAIEFDSVIKLVNGEQVVDGQPLVKGASVRAHVKKHGQDKGIIVFKMGRRQLYKKKHDRLWQYTVLKVDEIVFEDNTFSKRDLDPRKIRKAQAAVEVKKPRAAKPPAPVSQPEPVAVATPATVAETPQRVTPVSREARPANRSAGKWFGLAALLVIALLGFLFWSPTPTSTVTAEPVTAPTPVDVRLLQTRKIDQPADPAQPPD